MLKDRVILVTGSNSGIGFGIAKHCQAQGAKVVLHGRDAQTVKAAAQQLGADVGYVLADLLNPDAPRVILDAVMAQHGRIDGLVNNAALLNRNTLETVSSEIIDQMFAVNFRAPVMLMQAAVAQMKKQGRGGSIVNIGSVNALCGAPTLLAYSASKSALANATQNLAIPLAPDHIRINQLNVGWTITENENRIQVSEGQPENWQEHIPKALIPSGGLMTPAHIAQHAVFWLSDQSAPVTGQVFEVEQYPFIGRSFGTDWSDNPAD